MARRTTEVSAAREQSAEMKQPAKIRRIREKRRERTPAGSKRSCARQQTMAEALRAAGLGERELARHYRRLIDGLDPKNDKQLMFDALREVGMMLNPRAPREKVARFVPTDVRLKHSVARPRNAAGAAAAVAGGTNPKLPGGKND
jgi:hypothetical protein